MLLYTEKHVFFGVLEGAFLYQIVYTIASLMQIQILPIFFISKANELSKLNLFVSLLYTIDYTSSAWDVGKECR